MLKYKNKKYILVQDWDDLVVDTYKRPYVLQQQDGCQERGTLEITVPYLYPADYKNDTLPEVVNGDEMGVSFKAWLERDPTQQLKSKSSFELLLFWERNFYPDISMLINDLYSKGLIEPGEYTLDIDW